MQCLEHTLHLWIAPYSLVSSINVWPPLQIFFLPHFPKASLAYQFSCLKVSAQTVHWLQRNRASKIQHDTSRRFPKKRSFFKVDDVFWFDYIFSDVETDRNWNSIHKFVTGLMYQCIHVQLQDEEGMKSPTFLKNGQFLRSMSFFDFISYSSTANLSRLNFYVQIRCWIHIYRCIRVKI